MTCDIVKILALGYSKRFMWLQVGQHLICLRISDELYQDLKVLGVPTSQRLWGKKHYAR